MLFFGLQRITEIAGVVVSFDPKPIPVNTHISPNIFNLICSLHINMSSLNLYEHTLQGDWNGAGAHTNYR